MSLDSNERPVEPALRLVLQRMWVHPFGAKATGALDHFRLKAVREETDAAKRLRVAVIELVALFLVMEWVLWTNARGVLPRPHRTAGTVVLVSIVIGMLIRKRPSRSRLGLAPDSWFGGTGRLFGATAAGGLALLVASRASGAPFALDSLPSWLGRNWYLALGQQVVLQLVLMPRLDEVLGAGPDASARLFQPVNQHGRRAFWALVLGAALFAWLHLPNWPLVTLSFVAGFFWLAWFRRYRNFPAVCLSHGILGATAFTLLSEKLGHLRVGIAYLNSP